MTLSTFSHSSEPQYVHLSNEADIYLTGCVRSFICKVPVVINDKTLDLWPRSLKLTPDLLLSLSASPSDSGGHRGAGTGEQPGRWPTRWPPPSGYVSDSGTALQGVPEPPHGHTQQHQPQFCPLHCPQPREEGE